jgi:F-type H+-transporting ATPase subunit gamma
MAGVSTKEIKNRIRSMESTRQITKAMEMVAASKLRRAQNQILASRPYFQILSATIQDILKNNRDFSSPYLKERPVTKVMYIVIAGDRGLAGGYNSNILKMVETELTGKDAWKAACLNPGTLVFLAAVTALTVFNFVSVV